MTIEECYEKMGADYEGVVKRMGNGERVKKFLLKLPNDPSFRLICEAYDAGNGEEAFRGAHSLKGICMNLGLPKLQEAAEALTEALREGRITEESAPLLEQVKCDYQAAVGCIEALAQA